MKNNPVVWFEIYVKDMPRAKKFYEGVFKASLEKMTAPDSTDGLEMYGFPGDMTTMGASGALCKMQGFNPGSNSTVVYFGCDDCGVEEKRVKEFGGKVEKSKFSIGQYGNIALVYDSEGNMIGLHSMK